MLGPGGTPDKLGLSRHLDQEPALAESPRTVPRFSFALGSASLLTKMLLTPTLTASWVLGPPHTCGALHSPCSQSAGGIGLSPCHHCSSVAYFPDNKQPGPEVQFAVGLAHQKRRHSPLVSDTELSTFSPNSNPGGCAARSLKFAVCVPRTWSVQDHCERDRSACGFTV